jgi:hypothetical protein
MPIDEFELTGFISNFLFQEETTFEKDGSDLFWKEPYISPYDPYINYGWYIAFEDEVPEVSFSLVSEDGVPIYIFPILSDEMVDLNFYETFPSDFNYEGFEVYDFSKVKWDISSEDQYYTLVSIGWLLKNVDDFLITFPSYWLEIDTFFDFGDVNFIFNPITETNYSLSLPLLYFNRVNYEEYFGDVNWAVSGSLDEFPNFYITIWNLINSDYILDDIKPTITFSLQTTDQFYSYITLWTLFFSEYYEPSTISWANKKSDYFGVDPSVYVFNVLSCSVLIEDFDVIFSLVSEEYFNFIEMELVLLDDMGDFDYTLKNTESFEQDMTPYTIYFDVSKTPEKVIVFKSFSPYPTDVDYFRLYYFRYDTIYEPFVNWSQSVFIQWFDFEDFDCRMYSTQDFCTAIISDDFEIEQLLSITYALPTVDTFEKDAPDIIFHNIIIETFFDFDIYYLGSIDSFEFKSFSGGINNLVTEDIYNLFAPVIWWRGAERDLSFDNPVETPYLLHIEEYYSFNITPGLYFLRLEDNYEEVYFNIFEESIKLHDSKVILKNGRFMGNEWIDYE